MKLLKNINIRDGYSPAYILIIVILTLLAVFLLYGIFDPYISNVFPQAVIDNGGDSAWAEFSVIFWQKYLIIAFVISLIIFVIVNSQRDDGG